MIVQTIEQAPTTPQGEGQDPIKDAVDRETAGLQKTGAQLRAERDKVRQSTAEWQANIDELGDAEGLQQLAEMRKRFESDALGQLLQAGDYEGYFQAKSEPIRRGYERKLEALEREKETRRATLEKTTRRLSDAILQRQVDELCTAHRLPPGPRQDALMRARAAWRYDADVGRLVPVDERENQPFEKWFESLRSTTEHWCWGGVETGGHRRQRLSGRDPGKMTPTEYREWRESLPPR